MIPETEPNWMCFLMVRTSIEIPEELYKAFKRMGGVTLSLLVRDAMRDYIGIKGASEDALSVLHLKQERLREERIFHEQKLQQVEGEWNEVKSRIEQTQMNIEERKSINEQATIMKELMNPIIRVMNYKVNIITPEIHDVILQLKTVGLTHDLGSLQRHAIKLEQADWLLGGFRNTE